MTFTDGWNHFWVMFTLPWQACLGAGVAYVVFSTLGTVVIHGLKALFGVK